MKGYICIILPSILIGLRKTKILRYYTAIFINFIMRCPPKKGKGVKPLKKGFWLTLAMKGYILILLPLFLIWHDKTKILRYRMAIFIDCSWYLPLKKVKGAKPFRNGFWLTLAMKGYICIILWSILLCLDKTNILRYHMAIFINFVMRSPPKKGKGVKPLKKGFLLTLAVKGYIFTF